MLHYACLFWKNSCRLYTYSGKFPSLKRLCSGYGGKLLQEHLYIKLKVGVFPQGYVQPKLYPPECQVSCTKNFWTKLYGFLVCEIRRWILTPDPPGPPLGWGTPHSASQHPFHFCCSSETFFPPGKEVYYVHAEHVHTFSCLCFYHSL